MNEDGRVNSFRDLRVWKVGMDLVEQVYYLTSRFPKEEVYGLTSQLRRAAASIPANIAEGHARDSTKDFLRFISIAIGSLSEVETFVELVDRLKYADPEETQALLSLLSEERKMLRGLQKSLKAKLN